MISANDGTSKNSGRATRAANTPTRTVAGTARAFSLIIISACAGQKKNRASSPQKLCQPKNVEMRRLRSYRIPCEGRKFRSNGKKGRSADREVESHNGAQSERLTHLNRLMVV